MNTNTMMQRRSLRVTEQLVEELEGGRPESALVERILAAPSTYPHLLRACHYAKAQRYGSARADLLGALEHAGRTNTRGPVLELAAGLLAIVTRDYGLALELLESSARAPSAALRAGPEALALCIALGWREDGERVLQAVRAHAPEQPDWESAREQLRDPSEASDFPQLRQTFDDALAAYARGKAEAANAQWLLLRDEQAAGLLSDAARALELQIWLDEDGEDDRPEVPLATRVAVLERARDMLGVLGYRSAVGTLRAHGARAAALHARDEARAEQAERLVHKALARYSGPRPA